MNAEIKKVLELHKKYLSGEVGGVKSNLSSANLSSADLSSADLCFANLSSANLSSADLSSANLSSANLSSADLSSADLSSANLSYADLSSADLQKSKFSILNALRSNWGDVSEKLCLEMMRWDAISCGDESIRKWIETGECPFKNSEREFYFKENKKLWIPGTPKMNHRELWEALCAEKNIKIGGAE